MQSAQEYAHNLGLSPIVTSYNGTAYTTGEIVPYLQAVQNQGIKWLLVMAQDPDGLDASNAIEALGIDLWVKWITIAPADTQFVHKMTPRGAEFFSVRMMPSFKHASRWLSSCCMLGIERTAG